jgi:hypothetical protein
MTRAQRNLILEMLVGEQKWLIDVIDNDLDATENEVYEASKRLALVDRTIETVTNMPVSPMTFCQRVKARLCRR